MHINLLSEPPANGKNSFLIDYSWTKDLINFSLKSHQLLLYSPNNFIISYVYTYKIPCVDRNSDKDIPL